MHQSTGEETDRRRTVSSFTHIRINSRRHSGASVGTVVVELGHLNRFCYATSQTLIDPTLQRSMGTTVANCSGILRYGNLSMLDKSSLPWFFWTEKFGKDASLVCNFMIVQDDFESPLKALLSPDKYFVMGASEVSCCSETRGQQKSTRSSRARINILIYQFPAAAEAVMDDVLLALQHCYELLW
ncbi:Hypothetical predicted protein [Scomber scombrus]|uniref:Uncharacterized protein n=1 Tax=Scomber scombrus TaxID=13677 RepID=A0AAV1Q0F3_SCOSC